MSYLRYCVMGIGVVAPESRSSIVVTSSIMVHAVFFSTLLYSINTLSDDLNPALRSIAKKKKEQGGRS